MVFWRKDFLSANMMGKKYVSAQARAEKYSESALCLKKKLVVSENK